MLKFFSAGHLSRYVAIFLLLGFFWIPAFIVPQSYYTESENLFTSISGLFDVNIHFSVALAFILIIFSALLINQLTTEFEFSSRYSNLGLFYFVILSSALPAFFTFNPIILANIFILFLLKGLFKLPTNELTIPLVFNSGLLVGFASLFFPPLVLLLLFIWIAIFMHRLSSWRNLVASVIGMLMPYLFIFTWYLWAGSVLENINFLVEKYFFIPQFSLPDFSFELLIIITFL